MKRAKAGEPIARIQRSAAATRSPLAWGLRCSIRRAPQRVQSPMRQTLTKMDLNSTTLPLRSDVPPNCVDVPALGAACLSDISEQPRKYPKAVRYRNGIKIDWTGFFAAGREGGRGGQRGKVESLSEKSLRRLAFALGASPRAWGAMATLTFRETVVDGRKALKRFQRLMNAKGYADLHHGWVREYQGRGSVHYHYLWEREGLEARGLLGNDSLETIQRKKAQRQLIRGVFERDVVEAWSDAVGDTSEEFEAFQWGGIVELLAEGDSASRYFGSYLGKEEQKTLPEGAGSCGRWWWICRAAAPQPVDEVEVIGYPFRKPFSHVFDATKLIVQPLTESHETLPKGTPYREQFDDLRTTC